MIRLLLADDHPIVRAGLRALLANVDDIEVIGEVATAEDAVAWCADVDRTPRPDVVLMDLRFGEGLSGVEATRSIHELPMRPMSWSSPTTTPMPTSSPPSRRARVAIYSRTPRPQSYSRRSALPLRGRVHCHRPWPRDC